MDLLCGSFALLLSALLAPVRHRRLQGGGVEMPPVPRQASLNALRPGLSWRIAATEVRPIARSVALGLFGFYLLWNALSIASGRVPVSILKGLTGLPCPTTGGIRSTLALLHGQWMEALLWNPFAPVYAGILALSAITLGARVYRREQMVLSPLLARVWILSLVAGWVAKFAIGPKYW
jgi:hypothetical protein